MSVMMGMRIAVDPARFEAVAREKSELLEAVASRAKEMGAIHHVFLAGDGEVIVADEWDSEQSFHAFFEASGEEIGALMAAAGVTNEPQPMFARPIDTPDRF
jgi:heme-degrading monooxygenase HmoA